MREIKFRAWDKWKKKFIPDDVWAVCNQPKGREQAVMIKDWEEYKEGESFYPENEVLMQYTGLKDANSKEIYEGDILEFSSFEHGKGRVVVEYRGSMFIGLRFKDISEVIGNIYENPELLDQ